MLTAVGGTPGIDSKEEVVNASIARILPNYPIGNPSGTVGDDGAFGGEVPAEPAN
jgi:hypothetical protein